MNLPTIKLTPWPVERREVYVWATEEGRVAMNMDDGWTTLMTQFTANEANALAELLFGAARRAKR